MYGPPRSDAAEGLIRTIGAIGSMHGRDRPGIRAQLFGGAGERLAALPAAIGSRSATSTASDWEA